MGVVGVVTKKKQNFNFNLAKCLKTDISRRLNKNGAVSESNRCDSVVD